MARSAGVDAMVMAYIRKLRMHKKQRPKKYAKKRKAKRKNKRAARRRRR